MTVTESEKNNTNFTENIKGQIRTAFMSFMFDITKLKTKIQGKKIIDCSDNDLLLFESTLRNYSEKKKLYCGENFEYILDVVDNSQQNLQQTCADDGCANEYANEYTNEYTNKYKTLDDISGINVTDFFSNRNQHNQHNEYDQNNETNSNDQFYESCDDTESNYDYGDNELTCYVDEKMKMSIDQLNNSIKSRGNIEKIIYVTDHIILVDNEKVPMDQYIKTNTSNYDENIGSSNLNIDLRYNWEELSDEYNCNKNNDAILLQTQSIVQ